MDRVRTSLFRAARRLAASPGFTLTALLTLSLAIGATTAIFSAVQAVLLAPMALRDPGSLVIGWGRDPERTEGVVELSYLDVADLGRGSTMLASSAAVASHSWNAVLDGEGEPSRLSYAGVSGTFFETLGAPPLLGRVLAPSDDVANAESVAVMSHGLWVRRFGSDPSIVGRTIKLDDEPTRIVGVMPPSFDYPRGVDYWAPLAPGLSAAGAAWNTDVLRNVGVLYLLGRTKPGVTPAMAAGELTALAQAIQQGAPGPCIGQSVTLEPFLEHVLGPSRPALWALFGAVALLLVIACANVSGLMLSRVAARERERAVLHALGAPRKTVALDWLSEVLLLAVAGGALGLLTARWLNAAIVSLAPEGIPRLDAVTINLPVAAFAALVVTLAALLCGVGPIRQAAAVDVVAALREDGRASSGRRSLRARSSLLVAQVALASVLLVAAGLILRSFTELRSIDLGFEPSRLLSVQVDPRIDPAQQNAWVRDLLARISAQPGVEAAGAVYLRPLALGPIGMGTQVVLDGEPETPEAASRHPILNYQVATPDYFRAMRMPLQRGRLFSDADTASSPRVVVVGESTAARLWPGQDPIGQRFLTSTFVRGGSGPRTAWRTVVGVVGDVRYRGIGEVQLDMYDPASQSPLPATDLMIRTTIDPLSLVAVVVGEARAVKPDVIVTGITTMEAVVARAMAPWRFASWILVLFAALALLLSIVGLVGLVSLDVAQRQREFAIRLALGAARRQVTTPVLRGSLLRAAGGAGLGLAAAAALSRSLHALLVGVPPLHWPTYLAVAAVVLLAAALAAWLPTRWAANVDPVALLRR